MTLFDDWPPWRLFQARIRLAVSRAADEHESTRNLQIDLEMCEMFLRDPNMSMEEFQTIDSPVASELGGVLKNHATEDLVQYDEICAANVVLAVINGLEQADIGD